MSVSKETIVARVLAQLEPEDSALGAAMDVLRTGEMPDGSMPVLTQEEVLELLIFCVNMIVVTFDDNDIPRA